MQCHCGSSMIGKGGIPQTKGHPYQLCALECPIGKLLLWNICMAILCNDHGQYCICKVQSNLVITKSHRTRKYLRYIWYSLWAYTQILAGKKISILFMQKKHKRGVGCLWRASRTSPAGFGGPWAYCPADTKHGNSNTVFFRVWPEKVWFQGDAVKPHLKAKFAYNSHPDFTVKIF